MTAASAASSRGSIRRMSNKDVAAGVACVSGMGSAGGMGQAECELFGRESGREQEPLSDRDPDPQQELALGFVLHALGNQVQAQVLGDADHGLADRDVGAVV